MKNYLLGAVLLTGALGLLGCSSEDNASGENTSFCAATQGFNEALDSINRTISDAVSPDDLRDEMRSFMNTVTELVDNAPPELEGDAHVVSDGITEFANVLEDYDHDIEAVVAASETSARLEVLTSEGFLKARDNLDAAFSDECE